MILGTKRILALVVSLQIAFLMIITLDWFGLGIPVLRQIIGFIYLTFVPGILLLGILRINNLDTIEAILYSVGLSLFFLMFMGLLVNTFYPLIGISRPISEQSMVLTVATITAFLCIFFFFRNREFKLYIPNIKCIISPQILLLSLLPLISIIGAFSLNYNNDNRLLLTMYGIVSILPIIVSLNRLPDKMLPFVVWVISISLLLSVPLSTRHLSQQSDALVEFYYAKLVYTNNVWDPSISENMNSMLRIVILHPMYSLVLNMSLIDVFKIVHPLHYSFTPLALYISYRRLLKNEKIAFLASFLFMSTFLFYASLSRNTRNGIAELFLALFVLTITNKSIPRRKRATLLLMFVLSIIVSHYATSYIFLLALITSTFLLIFVQQQEHQFLGKEEKNINWNFAILYIVSTFTWYIYTSNASSYKLFVNFFDHMIGEILSGITLPEASYTVYSLTHKYTFSIEVLKIFIIFTNIFVAIEILALIWNILKNGRTMLQVEYSLLSIAFFGIFLATILPTTGLGTSRVYHTALIFLAPFSVTGFVRICMCFRKVLRNSGPYNIVNINIINNKNCLKIFAVLLMFMLLFDSGFISETLTRGNDYPPNVLISKPRTLTINDAQYIRHFSENYFSDHEIFSAKWLSQVRDHSMKIYMDRSYRNNIFYLFINASDIYRFCIYVSGKNEVKNGYIFFRTYNVIRHVSITGKRYPPEAKDLNDIYPLENCSKIYTNGGSEIYFKAE